MKKKKKLKKRFRVLLLGLFLILSFIIVSSVYNKKDDVLKIKTNLYYEGDSVYPDLVYGVPVYNKLIDIGSTRPGTKRIIKYIVIHETDNYEAGVGAENHAFYLKDNNDGTNSWHYTVDDHEIYHHIPDNEIAYHAGEESGNKYGIGIELCVNSDGNFEDTFLNGAKLVAYLLKAYNLDIRALKTHHDFNGKDCPHSILEDNRLDEFKEKVEYYYNK